MNTADSSTNPYDEVLYPAAVHVHTNPDRLATVGLLRGMRPPPVDQCRVLEIGCGVGSNLLSMAFNYPQSSFLGIDLARDPIVAGQESIAELGLKNLRLQQLDLCDANHDRFGSFDYIIAHGLYSWVPQSVRECILALCRDRLSAQGIAYISYNAYPGNHLRELARGIIRFHTAYLEQPLEKVQQARGILGFLANSRLDPDAYITVLKSEFERVTKYRDEAFFHDDLSEINQPFYFYEFVNEAERHSLQFLGESSPNEIDRGKVTADVLSKLSELQESNEILREQYKDFVRGCGFRRTLLCHQGVQLAPARIPEEVRKLHISCDAVPVQSDEAPKSGGIVFRQPDGTEIKIADPLMSAALKYICSEWPCTVPFAATLDRARSSACIGTSLSSFDDDAAGLAEAVLRAYEDGLIQLHTGVRPVANKVSEHPVSSPLARFQLKRSELATSQLHKFVRLKDPLGRQLVQLLDGTRNQEAIIDGLLASIASGQTELYENGAPLTDPHLASETVKRRLPEVLRALMREGLLVA
ncbi:MAG: methyltransferase regulatory domain-containing protein [Verrucomicrobia bacterium]|nr:methyltransferase regulatory domain-containing protein [Verrucomicrobiota bacterium]